MRKSSHIRGVVGGAALAVLVTMASGASGQEVGPPVTIGPWTGYSFFPSAQARGPLVIIPSVTFTAEYNDNIFLNNDQREADLIMAATPSLRLTSESARHRLAAGYSLTGEKYLDHTELDEMVRRHDVFLDASYQATPSLSLFAHDSFVASNNSNVTNLQGISTGRANSLSNAISGGFTWQFVPTTALAVSGSWALSRYDVDTSPGSDTYRASVGLSHAFTPRFSGSVAYEAGYIEVDRQPSTTTHTPRLGVVYRITDTLTGDVSAGPSLSVQQDDTHISTAATAGLVQRLKLGLASLTYDRSVGTASGIGGTTDNQTVAGSLVLTGLARNLSVEFVPSFHKTESTESNAIDVSTVQASLRAAYQFTTWFTGLVGYNFYRQRGGPDAIQVVTPVDQNRIFFGLQFGVPFRRD